MKKLLLLTAAAALVFPAASYADLKVGTVDMNRAFKEYNKTKDSEKKINEAKDAAKKAAAEVHRAAWSTQGTRGYTGLTRAFQRGAMA